jgi:hypothetical protein
MPVINRLTYRTGKLEFADEPTSYEPKLIFCFHNGELLNSKTLPAAIYLSLQHSEHLCQLTAKSLKSSNFITADPPTHLYSLTHSTTDFLALFIMQAT